ncbi:MAG: arginine--tRNA ligase, partial [Clostridia bacterium]|nr:arginine--tRNA ligase [Clostridia bacterium]
MNFKDSITKIISKVVKKLGYDGTGLSVSFSNRPELCDFQSNYAMIVAKSMGLKPIDVAQKIVENVKSDEYEFSAVMPGFINIKVTDKALSEFAQFVADDKNLGVAQVENPKSIVFDYGGANVAKELHVGHLRSPIVGEALKRLHMVMGDKTVSDVHLGDFGLQMGLTILQLHQDGFLDEFFAKDADISKLELKNVTLDVLNEEYPKASKRKDED